VAEACAGSTKVVRRQFFQSDPFCRPFHDVPDGFFGHPLTQYSPHLRHATEDLPSLDPRSIQPDAQLFHHPPANWNRANVSCLALQIDNGSVFLPLIQMFEPEANGFVAAQPAGKQQSKKGAISLALEPVAIRGSPEREALLNSQPVVRSLVRIQVRERHLVPTVRNRTIRTANGHCSATAQPSDQCKRLVFNRMVLRLLGTANACSLMDGSRTPICMVAHDPRLAGHAQREVHLFDGK